MREGRSRVGEGTTTKNGRKVGSGIGRPAKFGLLFAIEYRVGINEGRLIEIAEFAELGWRHPRWAEETS
jgi:hypothetical protein